MTCKCSSSAIGRRPDTDRMVSMKRIAVVAAVVLLLSMAVVGAASAVTVTIPADTDYMHYTATADGQPYTSGTDVPEGTVVVINAVPQIYSYVVTCNGWNLSTKNVKNLVREHNKLTFEVETTNVTITADKTSAHTLVIPSTGQGYNMTYTAKINGNYVAVTDGYVRVAEGERVSVEASYTTEVETGYGVKSSDWSVNIDGSSTAVSYTPSHNSVEFDMPDNNVRVESVETSAPYKLTYSSNNATLGEVPAEPSWYSVNEEVIVSGNTGGLTKDGSVFFAGWKNNDTDVTYLGGTSNTSFYITDNVTLRAQWDTGYTEVEYLESSGGQIIYSGVIIDQDSDVYSKVRVTKNFNYTTLVYGAYNHTNRAIDFDTISGRWYYGAGGNDIDTGVAVDGTIKYVHQYLRNNVKYLVFDDTEYSSSFNKGYCTNYSLALFAQGGVQAYYSYAQIYYLKIYKTDLVRNFVPCINPLGAAGMYDTVEGKFYENTGTGYFKKGDPVYRVTYSVNGGTNAELDDQIVIQDNSVTTLYYEGTRTGYTQVAGVWNTKADGTGTDVAMNEPYTPSGSITLYAKWGGKVVYDANGANSGTEPVDSKTYYAGETVNVAENTGNLTKTGYYFAGWNSRADGTGIDYAAGSEFQYPGSLMILYAKWVPASYVFTVPSEITLSNAEGGYKIGEISVSSTGKYTGKQMLVTLSKVEPVVSVTGLLVKNGDDSIEYNLKVDNVAKKVGDEILSYPLNDTTGPWYSEKDMYFVTSNLENAKTAGLYTGKLTFKMEITDCIPVTSVTLNKATTTIGKGGNETLTVTVSPDEATDKTVAWSSSDTNVATVNSEGLVTGIDNGVVTITATAIDGSSVSGSCVVTVTGLPSWYTEVEYIESTGTQYIDTEILLGNSTPFTVIMEGYFTKLTGEYQLHGLHSNTILLQFGINPSNYYNVYAPGSSTVTTSCEADTSNHIMQYDINSERCTLTLDGDTIGTATASVTGDSNVAFLLFGRNYMGSVDCYCHYAMKRCEIYKDGKLIRNFVPCVYHYGQEDAVVGLFDVVYGLFYTNRGSEDDFIAGAPVVS